MSRVGKSIETQQKLLVARGWEKMKKGVTAKEYGKGGCRVGGMGSLGVDKNVLNLDYGYST